MANWKETLEPYVKVIESVKSAPLNPTAGTDLIIGAVIISDRGPSTPTLVSSQKQFLALYAAKDLTQEYTDSLNELYTGGDNELASTMWLNAYRLAGSGSLLVTRAGKTNGITFAKPLSKDQNADYIFREGEFLKAVEPFKIVLDNEGGILTEEDASEVTSSKNGWAISIRDTGVFGNRVNDNGPLYDYYVDNLYDLVQKLNETTKFYIPDYEFFSDIKCESVNKITDPENHKDEIRTVRFNHVYLAGGKVMEPEVYDAEGNVEYWGKNSTGTANNHWGDVDSETGVADLDSTAIGCAYLIPASLNYNGGPGEQQKILDLNDDSYSGFESPKYLVRNLFNSRVDLTVRVRRFNHNAVQNIQVEEGSTNSPYKVITSVLNVYTNEGAKTGKEVPESIRKYDFYEFCIYDPAVSSDAQIFNVGQIPGRGDITIADLNDNLSSIHLDLPLDLIDLGLEYYGFGDNGAAEEFNINAKIGKTNGNGVDNSTPLIKVSDNDIMNAFDQIEKDERYIVEGLTDCGCTNPAIQNYIANIATQSNYFYPASTAASTNYMVIANKKQKVTKRNSNVYWLAPYDLDDGTVGYLFNCMSSTLYWEVVFNNRRTNMEFASAFGQNNGICSVVNLAKEFNKEERQLLLTKKINSIFRDVYLERIYINDNFTSQEEDNVWKEECNVRLRIRISKAMPVILNQFKGRKNNQKLWDDTKSAIDYWMKTTVLAYGETISDWQVICDETINTPEEIRANRLNVILNVRYPNSVKYITVYHKSYPIGVPFDESKG